MSKQLGDSGETLVASYLEKQGYDIVARNYRISQGEIDIIACKEDNLAFVEVKTRKSLYFPLDMVITLSKQRKIIKAAKTFLSRNLRYMEFVARFDVAFVVIDRPDAIEYIENAFQAEQ